MPISTKIIKNRIKSVKNIRKITKAMEMVSAAKMKRAVEHALSTRSYAELALELLVNISKEKGIHHLLLDKREKGRKLVLVIASNKGLCGGFNANVAKHTAEFFQNQTNTTQVDFVTVGKKAENMIRRLGGKIVASFINLPNNPHIEDIGGLSQLVIDEFSQGKYNQVVMIFTNFISSIKYEVKLRGLLPITPENIKDMIHDLGRGGIEEKEMRLKNMSLYLFEPNEEAILGAVLPKLTKIQIYQALLESDASEHSARMMTMQNASSSANEMIDDLELTFNQARQSGITQEIAEISSGAIALGK